MNAITRAVIVGLALLPLGCGAFDDVPTSAQVFESTFGAPPGPSIGDLQAFGRTYGNNVLCYLKFRTSREPLDRLLGSTFKELTDREFRAKASGAGVVGPIPTWWQPMAGSPTDFLESHVFHPGCKAGHALVSYDSRSQVVHMYWDGAN